jgi:hypothetical protein
VIRVIAISAVACIPHGTVQSGGPHQVYMKTTLFGLFGKVEIAEEKITKLPSILQIEKFLVAILFLDLTHGDLSF